MANSRRASPAHGFPWGNRPSLIRYTNEHKEGDTKCPPTTEPTTASRTSTATGTSPTPPPHRVRGRLSPPSTSSHWDGLSPAVTQALGQPLDPELVSQRRGRGNKSFDYLEGHAVIDQANRIFGFGGWGYELAGDVTLRRIETVDKQTGEVTVSLGYSAPVRVTVAGALPRTDIGVHPVTEDNFDGHDTAIKGAVTDGMKRAFRSFGVQFGNGFYGDQPAASAPKPERAPTQARANGGSGRSQPSRPTRQAPPKGGNDAQAEKLRKRLFEIASEQGIDDAKVREAVTDRTGKSIDDLTAAELSPLVEAAANKLRAMQQEQVKQAA